MASLDRNIRSPGVGNGKKRVVKGDINRGLLSLRTRGRGREKRKSRKRGDKSVIFEDASSIPCTRCTSLWMDTCVRYVCRNVSRDCLRGRERVVGRRGRYFCLVNFLWTFVREVGRGGKLVITRVWLLREGREMKESSGRSSRFRWIDGNTVLTPRLVGQLVPGSILVTRGIADNLVRSLSTFVR